MKRKITAIALCAVMFATAIIGGTLAYFTDEEQVTNTMTIGNVEINIEEVAKVKVKGEDGKETYVYEPFEDGKFTLYPVTNDEAYGNANDHLNKIVRTFNTSDSKHDAYIRTLALIEKNDVLTANHVNDGNCCVPGVHFYVFGADTPVNAIDGHMSHGSKCTYAVDENGENIVVNINQEDYYVVVFTAKDEKPIPYDHALQSMNAVWLDKNIEQEDIAGWGADGKVDIIIFSQGIQSYDLTHDEAMEALGDVTKANVESWIGADDAVINDWVNN